MLRTARAAVGGMCYHAINRGNGRAGVFHKEDDYVAFVKLVEQACARLHVDPVRYEGNWLRWVNRPQTPDEEAALQPCIARGRPYGGSLWQRLTARRLRLESSLRHRGRPRLRPKK